MCVLCLDLDFMCPAFARVLYVDCVEPGFLDVLHLHLAVLYFEDLSLRKYSSKLKQLLSSKYVYCNHKSYMNTFFDFIESSFYVVLVTAPTHGSVIM